MAHSVCRWAIALVVVWVWQLGAALAEVDIVGDRCARWHHSSMLRDTSVFIDGGVQLFRNSETTWLGFSRYIFELDMSRSWDATTNLTEKRIGRFAESAKNANPPNMVRGALFRGPSTDRRLFTFGGSTFLANTSEPGWMAPTTDQYSLWSFDTVSLAWNQFDITDAAPRRPNWGAWTESIGAGMAFVLNGIIDKGSNAVMYSLTEYIGGKVTNVTEQQVQYLGGMLVIDLPTQKARNVSTESLGVPRVAGGLIHSPLFGRSKAGTLITFGGMVATDPRNNTFYNGALLDMKTVSLLDSFNDPVPIWINQTTTGDIPPPRIDFCVLPGTKTPSDNSSFNFYFYGGYDPTKSIVYDDVHVLSLPSFTWTKVYSGNAGRFGHTCHTAGKRQMLSVGGALDASMYAAETVGNLPDLSSLKCDANGGVRLFDLTSLTWGTFFNASAEPWKVPSLVTKKIGGDGNGGAKMKQPEGGFSDPAMPNVFNPPPIGPPDTSVIEEKKSSSSKTSAIVGGVVGAVAGIALIAIAGIILLRRKARKTAEKDAPAELGPSEKTEMETHAKQAMGSPETVDAELMGDTPVYELPGFKGPYELGDTGVKREPAEKE